KVGDKEAGAEESKFRMVIDGDKLTAYLGEEKITAGTIKLDASKKPRHIDLSAEKGGPTKGPSLGIYEIDGDTLRMMLGSEMEREFDGKKEFVPSKRPKDFSDKSEPVMTFKRVKG